MPTDSFSTVLAAAIEDMIRSGFDSEERVADWMRKLREAAVRSLIPESSLDQRLKEGLANVYRKMVERDGILAHHPNVERFTYERLKPRLRSELDRRIMASADLIKLNRKQAVDKTLQRFSGWSTSIPRGGISGEKKRDVKENVRKSLAGLPFEERRVLIDQGHKLIASISEVIASDGGAIAMRWRSHWRQPGYNFREDHKDRDDKVYLLRDSWAHKAGLVKRGRTPYSDEITAPAQEPFCRCYAIWLYNLRDLPEDMLTAKGRAQLAAVQGKEEVRSARTARADDSPRADGPSNVANAGIAHLARRAGGEPACGGRGHMTYDREGFSALPAEARCKRCQIKLEKWDAIKAKRGVSFADAADYDRAPEPISVAYGLARGLDRLGYFDGARGFVEAPDTDQWNASFDDRTREITVQRKLGARPLREQIQVLLHEAGHAGQAVDRETYRSFLRLHLDKLASFAAMANPEHVRDWQKRGAVEGGLASEVFAESYARAALGLDLPPDLATFWGNRFAAEADAAMSQVEANYLPSWANAITRCQRCSMFARLSAGVTGNACTAVLGDISAHGHCALFRVVRIAA